MKIWACSYRMCISYFNMKDSLYYLLIRFPFCAMYLVKIADNLCKVWDLSIHIRIETDQKTLRITIC